MKGFLCFLFQSPSHRGTASNEERSEHHLRTSNVSIPFSSGNCLQLVSSASATNTS